jgi:hypothetical protein
MDLLCLNVVVNQRYEDNTVTGYDLETKTIGTYKSIEPDKVYQLTRGVHLNKNVLSYCIDGLHEIKLTLSQIFQRGNMYVDYVECVSYAPDSSSEGPRIPIKTCSIEHLNNKIKIEKNGTPIFIYDSDIMSINGVSKVSFNVREFTEDIIRLDGYKLPIDCDEVDVYRSMLENIELRDLYVQLLILLANKNEVSTISATCVICRDACPIYMLEECRHLLYCNKCRTDDACPICRKISRTVKVFY